ncbi:prominin-2-like [Heterodontus francisci]|uniref:prominin-2-like n=1 Tax=Heterodontus francisci TaxID=7792 RepID=UPI00355C779D
MHREGMALFFVLAVTFLNPQHAASQNCTAGRLQFQNVLEHGFGRLNGDAGSLEPLYNMVNRYLDAVQPNPFPTGIIQQLQKDQTFEAKEVVRYEAGYLVSFIIGVLFFVLMPLVGLFFCCCRCCKKCGGKVKERTKTTDCQRNTLAIFLLMTTLIILAGVACAFTANQKVTDATEPSVKAVNATITNVTSYIKNIVESVPKIAAQFSVPRSRVFSELDRTGRTLGLAIKDALDPIISPVLTMLFARVQEISNVKDHLITINSTQTSVMETQRQLAKELMTLQLDITATLTNPNCNNCGPNVTAVNNLELNINYSEPTELQTVLTRLTSISPASLNNSLEQGSRSFNEIPAQVTNQTAQIIADIKITIENIEKNISSISERVQIPDSLQSLTTSLNSPQVSEVSNSVKQYDYYRWIVGIVLCCIILLIIACNVLGLGLGTAGIATRDDPYRATGCSKSGANFLMAGVGFSFIFSWLLILLVFVTFFVGGNVRTLVCKPWESGEIYQVIDTLSAQDSTFNLSTYLNKPITVSELHRRCEKGESLFDILTLDQTVDLDTYLNLSTYSGDFLQNTAQLDVSLSSIVLLDSTAKSTLLAAANSGIESINYTNLIQQINKPILKLNLLDLANILEILNSSQPDATIRSNLTRQAGKLREIQNTLVSKMRQDLAQLNTSLQYLTSFAPSIQNVIQNTIQKTETAQVQINTTTLTVVNNVRECLTTKALGYFDQYLQWARRTILDNLLSCQPALILLDNSRVILCDYITDPWNAFWFCLGWCTLFLIPSIIFAVKTAKHYRSIKNKTSSPEFSEMTNFKFPRVQNTYGPLGTPLNTAPTAPTL